MLEQVICNYLKSDAPISDKLTKYDGEPAVFLLEAPTDQDELWDKGPQYPRIIYELSMQEDPERKTSGMLLVDLYLNTDSGLFLEEVAPVIQNAISGRFFTDEKDTIAAVWRQSDPFTTPEDGSHVAGITITFDVIAFPKQLTYTIDPVEAVNGYIKELYPNIRMIGVDHMESVWQATEEAPAAYVRLQRMNPGTFPSTYHVTWYNPVMMVHIMAPSVEARNSILRNIVETLQQRQRIILSDGSPLMMVRLALTVGADQLKEGQLSIEASYGLLRDYPDREPINNVSVVEE